MPNYIIYLVKYGVGAYSDYSESVYGAYWHSSNANKIADKFNLLSKYFNALVKELHDHQNEFIKQYDIDNKAGYRYAPAATYQEYQRTGKRMTGSEWKDYEKNILPGLLNEFNDTFALRNKKFQEFATNWWENKKKDIPEELKKYADIYPAECGSYSEPHFFVEEVEFKDTYSF